MKVEQRDFILKRAKELLQAGDWKGAVASFLSDYSKTGDDLGILSMLGRNVVSAEEAKSFIDGTNFTIDPPTGSAQELIVEIKKNKGYFGGATWLVSRIIDEEKVALIRLYCGNEYNDYIEDGFHYGYSSYDGANEVIHIADKKDMEFFKKQLGRKVEVQPRGYYGDAVLVKYVSKM